MSESPGPLQRLGAVLGRVVTGLLLALFFVLMVGVIVGVPYGLIRASSENFPRWLHTFVIVLAALLLGWGIYIVLTEDLRKKWFPWIFEMFGPFGPLVYGALILVSAAAVMASFTYILFDAGLVDMSSDLPGGLTEARLVDFYMWHFFELIPLVSINETANLAQPATYSGTWVGVLVLIFQVLVVAPILATIRYYFKEDGRDARRRYQEKRRVVSLLRAAIEHGADDETLSDFEARWERTKPPTPPSDRPTEE